MPQELPYLPTYKNVELLFDKIRSAKIPETFTQKFLSDSLGIKGSAHRPLIPLLKELGFIDTAGKPTVRYAALKNDKIAGIEIARGVREAFKPLFDANEAAHKLETQELNGLIAQVAGSDNQMTTKISGTFRALVRAADFESDSILKEDEVEKKESPEKSDSQDSENGEKPFRGMRPEFHYNIQIHLPANGSEETYMNIFNSVRKVFK